MGILDNFITAIVNLVRPAGSLESGLDKQAAGFGQPLDWRNSIVDLMKVVGHDSSLSARKQLAKELGYTGELNGSAEMNQWLHAKVMTRIR